MTPAIDFARRSKIPCEIHAYEHRSGCESYGEEAALGLGIDMQRVFKTLVVSQSDDKLAVGIVPVSHQLDLKRFAKAAGTKKVAMADGAQVEKSTGYVLGGVSPIGQKKRLKTVIDAYAQDFDTIYVSAGRRGLEIELRPDDLKMLTNGMFAEICQQGPF